MSRITKRVLEGKCLQAVKKNGDLQPSVSRQSQAVSLAEKWCTALAASCCCSPPPHDTGVRSCASHVKPGQRRSCISQAHLINITSVSSISLTNIVIHSSTISLQNLNSLIKKLHVFNQNVYISHWQIPRLMYQGNKKKNNLYFSPRKSPLSIVINISTTSLVNKSPPLLPTHSNTFHQRTLPLPLTNPYLSHPHTLTYFINAPQFSR